MAAAERDAMQVALSVPLTIKAMNECMIDWEKNNGGKEEVEEE